MQWCESKSLIVETRLCKDFQVKVGNLSDSLIEIKGGGHAKVVETKLNGLQCVLRNMNAEVRGC